MSGTPKPRGGERGSVVTVGTFDGVHLGHWAVLREIAARAKRDNRRSVLVTFVPHPLEIVNPQAAPQLLTVGDERLEILAQGELDLIVFLSFTKRLSQYSPEAFVRLLIERFQMQELVIGHDHGFGRGRSGDESLLRELGKKLGFEVDVVGAVSVSSRPASSTLVRRAVAGGDLDTAEELLGRPYSITAPVVRGKARGRQLGYRTINLEVTDPRKLLPPDGVYAVRAEWRDGAAGGMMHQGPRPTFGEQDRTLEAHLFGVDVELYDVPVKISWVKRLRDVMNFPDTKALEAQLARDLQAAETALTGSRGTATYPSSSAVGC
ncbi:MAG: riboflavin biosynthesis protein RibF [Gemmatimonadetes bacterium]|nr:riboflavin biosynthesis protein RibF [Gemmatimonadota bacterium]